MLFHIEKSDHDYDEQSLNRFALVLGRIHKEPASSSDNMQSTNCHPVDLLKGFPFFVCRQQFFLQSNWEKIPNSFMSLKRATDTEVRAWFISNFQCPFSPLSLKHQNPSKIGTYRYWNAVLLEVFLWNQFKPHTFRNLLYTVGLKDFLFT